MRPLGLGRHRNVELLDLRGAARFGGFERLRPHEDDRGLAVGLHGGDLRAAEVRHLRDKSAAARADVIRVRDETGTQTCGQPSRDLARVGREAEQDEVWFLLLVQRREGVGGGFRDVVVERPVLVDVHHLRSVLAERRGSRLGA